MYRKADLDVLEARESARHDALRHPDGSIDFGAYRKRARQARDAAIKSSLAAAWSMVANGFAGRAAPAPGRHVRPC